MCPFGAARSYQAHGDRLQGDVVRLGDELETQKLNLRDINEFLTNELKVGACVLALVGVCVSGCSRA